MRGRGRRGWGGEWEKRQWRACGGGGEKANVDRGNGFGSMRESILELGF